MQNVYRIHIATTHTVYTPQQCKTYTVDTNIKQQTTHTDDKTTKPKQTLKHNSDNNTNTQKTTTHTHTQHTNLFKTTKQIIIKRNPQQTHTITNVN